MVIDFEHIQDISIEHDGIVITQAKGDTVHLQMTFNERRLLEARLKYEDPDKPRVALKNKR